MLLIPYCGAEPSPKHKTALPVWVSAILSAVCEERQVAIKEVCSSSRVRSVIGARSEVFYLLKTKHATVEDIGRWFRCSHVTVLNLIARHSDETGAPSITGYDRAGKIKRDMAYRRFGRADGHQFVVAQSNEVRG